MYNYLCVILPIRSACASAPIVPLDAVHLRTVLAETTSACPPRRTTAFVRCPRKSVSRHRFDAGGTVCEAQVCSARSAGKDEGNARARRLDSKSARSAAAPSERSRSTARTTVSTLRQPRRTRRPSSSASGSETFQRSSRAWQGSPSARPKCFSSSRHSSRAIVRMDSSASLTEMWRRPRQRWLRPTKRH